MVVGEVAAAEARAAAAAAVVVSRVEVAAVDFLVVVAEAEA